MLGVLEASRGAYGMCQQLEPPPRAVGGRTSCLPKPKISPLEVEVEVEVSCVRVGRPVGVIVGDVCVCVWAS